MPITKEQINLARHEAAHAVAAALLGVDFDRVSIERWPDGSAGRVMLSENVESVPAKNYVRVALSASLIEAEEQGSESIDVTDLESIQAFLEQSGETVDLAREIKITKELVESPGFQEAVFHVSELLLSEKALDEFQVLEICYDVMRAEVGRLKGCGCR